ncbi:MAG: hypothetical protein JO079_01530, partial [Frankiaceae bacterium]|nr:hypothetical protein [Frankiaceae bacterium]
MSDGGAEATLGRTVASHFRRPGPPLTRSRPSPIGSVAMAATRFAAATAHSPDVRRSLRGPEPIRTRQLGQGVQPPRWWQYWWSMRGDDAPAPAADAAPVLPPRGLPRVVRTGSDEGARPGHMVGRLGGDVVRVRRPPEVTSVGPMLVERERSTAAAPANRAPANRGPGDRAPANRAGEAGPRPAPAAPSSTSAADFSADVVRRMSATGSPAPVAPAASVGAPSAIAPAGVAATRTSSAVSPPPGRWGALRHAATPRSRAAAAAAAT